ncbi:MAG: protein phosphatase 2C domain-containing protein [Planctomycetes bacterium]|nr:protein phosphatase 2C domain-containing protein [Planctomycetota bacterium]
MRVTSTTFQLGKDGSGTQDRYAVIIGRTPAVRVLIADGAGTTYRSGEFAEELCRAGSKQRALSGMTFDKAVREAAARWTAANRPSRKSPWWERKSYTKGATAAFLCLDIVSPTRWAARAVGDCQLVVEPNGVKSRRLWPFTKSTDFPKLPLLLSAKQRVIMTPHLMATRGRGRRGWTFYVMTDGLAEGVLRMSEHGLDPWKSLRALSGDEEFEDFVENLYEVLPDHKRDDMTLVRLEVL